MMNGYWANSGTGYAPWGTAMNSSPWFWALHYFLGIFTWLLIVAIMVALLRLLWKKGNGK